MNDRDFYPKRKEWYPVNSIGPNISHYIYLDVNRNGIYDIEDKPLAKIAVKMTRPDGSTVIRRSNINGFVNFKHSLTQENVDVKEPGRYKFEVLIPEGWKMTSNNNIQYVTYSKDEQSRSGFVVDQVPIPAGIVQELYIKGKIINCKNTNTTQVIATKGEVEIKSKLDSDGSFRLDIDPGLWHIKVIDTETNKVKEREINVVNEPIYMSSIDLKQNKPNKKRNLKTIDFEDITKLEIQKVPNGVANLNWENLIVTNKLFYKGEGYINNTISGEYCGYNTSGTKVKISKDEGFDFYGGYFGVAWLMRGEGETIHFKAWRGNSIVGNESFFLSALGPFWFEADYRDITLLEIWTEHCWQFVTDGIKIGVN